SLRPALRQVVPNAQMTASGAIAATASGQPEGSAIIASIRTPSGIGASRRVRATSRTPLSPGATSITCPPTSPVAPASSRRRGPASAPAPAGPRSDIRQPGRRFAEYPAILLDRIAVGHPGDEIGDVAAAVRLGAGQAVEPAGRHQVGLLVIGREQ